MSGLGEVLASERHIAAERPAGPARRRRAGWAALRPQLRELVMLWTMRGAMLAYVLGMVAAAEVVLHALRRLF